MSSFENIVYPNKETEKLLRGLDSQALALAQNFERRTQLEAFLDIYSGDTEHEELRGTDPFYSAISPTGALVQLRRRRHLQGQLLPPEQRYAAVTGAVWSTDTTVWPTVTAHDQTSEGRIASTLYHLGYAEAGQGLLDTSLNPIELAMQLAHQVADNDSERDRHPSILYEHGKYTVRWEDGYTERLHEAQNVQKKASLAVQRGLGAPAVGGCSFGERERLEVV